MQNLYHYVKGIGAQCQMPGQEEGLWEGKGGMSGISFGMHPSAHSHQGHQGSH